MVPAAGLGSRFGGALAKQWVEVAGRPVLEWTLRRLLRLEPLSVVVALPPGAVVPVWLEVPTVVGGPTRAESVLRALAALAADDSDLVAVHDAARPAVGLEDFRRVVQTAAVDGAAILGCRVRDTLKRLGADGRVEATVDRSNLGRAQTPQVARLGQLREALASDGNWTDEAGALEARGVAVTWVEATVANPKLTTPGDAAVVAALLTGEPW